MVWSPTRASTWAACSGVSPSTAGAASLSPPEGVLPQLEQADAAPSKARAAAGRSQRIKRRISQRPGQASLTSMADEDSFKPPDRGPPLVATPLRFAACSALLLVAFLGAVRAYISFAHSERTFG